MAKLLHSILESSARTTPDATALISGNHQLTYAEFQEAVHRTRDAFITLGIHKGDRIAIQLRKSFETVIAFYAAAACGAIFIPINPVAKTPQRDYILKHSGARMLIIQSTELVAEEISSWLPAELDFLISITGQASNKDTDTGIHLLTWQEMMHLANQADISEPDIDSEDLASIIYTSGSTGMPKGVMLSHANLTIGAESVVGYLNNTSEDRLLALLPFSFDYGLSQLTTAIHSSAALVLMDYLLPNDVMKQTLKHGVTGIAAVPSLWIQLARMEWPEQAAQSLRYITNSGGSLPVKTYQALKSKLPGTDIFLMYGLTEAFRSTYLPPEIPMNDASIIGIPIPNAELKVINAKGQECESYETGELVQLGPLVSKGYWQNREDSSKRFRTLDQDKPGNTALWSGDHVYKNDDGIFFFAGRTDNQIKTTGYRVSPTEIEEAVLSLPGIDAAIICGVPHPVLEQAIVCAYSYNDEKITNDRVASHCRNMLPTYMVPTLFIAMDKLPLNANGKFDRIAIQEQYKEHFTDTTEA